MNGRRDGRRFPPRRLGLVAALAIVALQPLPAAQSEVPTDAAAEEYLRLCAGCHTVGGGDLSGPDLLPATAWPEDDLRVAVERMEKNVGPLGAQLVDRLVDLLRAPDVAERLDRAREARRKSLEATLEPPSPERGRRLFFGDRTFAAGAVPCSACHRYGGAGGTLAVSLTDAEERLGRSALQSAAQNPSWPAMRAAYGRRPVTAQEAADLAAYLSSAEPPPKAGGAVGAGALVLAALTLAATPLALRRRSRGVRAELVRSANRR